MSDNDQVRPYHAKNAAPGQEAADVVAEVLKHAAEREEAAKQKTTPKGPPKWMLPVTVNLGVLALYFLIASPDFLVVNPPRDTRPPAEVLASTRRAVYADGITRINNFLDQQGRLPQSLAEAGSPIADVGLAVTYTPQGDSTYLLIVSVGGEEIVFDSGTDDPLTWVGPMNMGG